MSDQLAPGDRWPGYHRGYRLQTNSDGDVWWQVYQGTTRLHLQPPPDDLMERLLAVDNRGGRMFVTEGGEAHTRVQLDDAGTRDIYLGSVSLEGSLVPPDAPELRIPLIPSQLTPGDVWPSVYDGAKFSFSGDRIWWEHPDTGRYHPVTTSIDSDLLARLQQYKPQGGSFRVTPWNAVITLAETMPDKQRNPEQIRTLPRVLKNITLKRKERGVEQLPVYVGSVEQTPFDIEEPDSRTPDLEPTGPTEGESWAASLGETTETTEHDHQTDPQE